MNWSTGKGSYNQRFKDYIMPGFNLKKTTRKISITKQYVKSEQTPQVGC